MSLSRCSSWPKLSLHYTEINNINYVCRENYWLLLHIQLSNEVSYMCKGNPISTSILMQSWLYDFKVWISISLFVVNETERLDEFHDFSVASLKFTICMPVIPWNQPWNQPGLVMFDISWFIWFWILFIVTDIKILLACETSDIALVTIYHRLLWWSGYWEDVRNHLH